MRDLWFLMRRQFILVMVFSLRTILISTPTYCIEMSQESNQHFQQLLRTRKDLEAKGNAKMLGKVEAEIARIRSEYHLGENGEQLPSCTQSEQGVGNSTSGFRRSAPPSGSGRGSPGESFNKSAMFFATGYPSTQGGLGMSHEEALKWVESKSHWSLAELRVYISK